MEVDINAVLPTGSYLSANADSLVRGGDGVWRIPAGQMSMAMSESTDQEYLAAVERGDMETAQTLVEDAARAAGYTVGPVYHGTRAKFNKFDMSFALDIGMHFGPENVSKYFGDVGAYYLNIENPLRVEDGGDDVGWAASIADALASIDSQKHKELIEEFRSIENGYDDFYDAVAEESEDLTDVDEWTDDDQQDWEENVVLETRQKIADSIRDVLLQTGFDSLVYENLAESGGNGDTFVALNPNQIKSADPVTYDNQGNPIPLSQRFTDSRDIRYQTTADRKYSKAEIKRFGEWVKTKLPGFKGDMAKLKHGYDTFREDGDTFDLPEYSTAFETFKHNIVNQMDPLKKVKESIEESINGVLPEFADAYTEEMLRISKTKAQINKADEQHFKPIRRLIALSKKTVKDVDEFLYARHAPEANARLRLTNARLELKKLSALRGDNDIERAIKKVDDKFEKNPFGFRQEAYLDLLEKELSNPKSPKEAEFKKRWEAFKENPSGMTDSEAEKIQAKHRNNKTLQAIGRKFDAMNSARLEVMLGSGRISFAEYKAMKDTFQHYAPLHREGFDTMPTRGRGISMLGSDVKTRGGSTKRAVDILAHAMAQYETSLIKAEKTKVARKFLAMVREYPHSAWQISAVKKVPGYDGSGNIVEHNDMGEQPNEIKIKLDGKVYSITAHNIHTQRIIEGLKGDNFQSGPIVNALSKINRVLAMVNTTLSPEFMISNFARDFQTALYNLSDTDIHKKKKDVIKAIPKAMKGMHSLWRGDKKHEWAKYAKQFEDAGGKIGWIDFAGDIQSRVKKLESEINLYRDGHVTKKAIYKLGRVIEDYNGIVENSMRLATFKTLIDNGVSERKAALVAKELTVNFNQKGVYGQLINSLYLFSNAGIQGSAKILSVLYRSPKARKMVYGTMLAATALAIANRGIGGDDDDGIPYYDKIEDYIRERNIIFMLPGGKHIKIPAPWGYNVFWVIGSEFGDMIAKPDYDLTESLARIISATVGAFNPLQSATILQTISPTIMDPFVQVGENATWSGSPLMPENNPFSRVKRPDSELYWRSARQPSVWMAKNLNEITGGNQIKPGAIDISPETLDLVWDTLTGSAGRFIADTTGLPFKIAQGEMELKDTPFVRRVFGQQSEYTDSTIYRENINHVYQLIEQMKTYPEESAALRKDPTWKLYDRARKIESAIKKLSKQRNLMTSDDKKKAVDMWINKLKRSFNSMVYQLRTTDKSPV
jgi:hypothetical protein